MAFPFQMSVKQVGTSFFRPCDRVRGNLMDVAPLLTLEQELIVNSGNDAKRQI